MILETHVTSKRMSNFSQPTLIKYLIPNPHSRISNILIHQENKHAREYETLEQLPRVLPTRF